MSAPRSLNACHVVPVHNPLKKLVKSSKFYSTYTLKESYRSCRACITKKPPDISIENRSARAAECTYNNHNSQWLSLELQHLLSMQKEKPTSGIVLTRGKWSWVSQEGSLYQLRGVMRFHNVTKRNEVFITEVLGRLRLFSTECLDGITTSIQIISRHPGGKPAPRNDGYWPVFIIRAGEDTSIEVVVQVMAEGEKNTQGPPGSSSGIRVCCLWSSWTFHPPSTCYFASRVHSVFPWNSILEKGGRSL